MVAERLGYTYVDTGAMYRAVTLEVLRKGIDPEDEVAVASLAGSVAIMMETEGGGPRWLLGRRDVTDDIRTPEVTRHVSAVSRVSGVRKALVSLQRDLGKNGGVVLEGRDIGTVVFPDADLKIFMVADLAARSRRRAEELNVSGREIPEDMVAEEIRRRDALDSGRAESPLVRAPDAIELDTSGLTIDEQVEFVVAKAEEKLKQST